MQERRELLYKLLGDLPPRERKVSCELVAEEEKEDYILETLVLDLNGIERCPAYFVKPKGKEKFSVMLYNHVHGNNYELGKYQLIEGSRSMKGIPYAKQLARMGIGALCVDMWTFGERRGLSESAVFKKMLWEGKVLFGMMVYDSLKAIDYLHTRTDVDTSRIGTMGMSMGSTLAWYVAALDTRIDMCIDICCLSDFESLIQCNALDYHGIYYYIPNLLKHFSTSTINELIAPRKHLSLAGIYDPLTPEQGLDKVDDYLKQVYAEQGVSQHWSLNKYSCGHFETAKMRQDIVTYIKEQWL